VAERVPKDIWITLIGIGKMLKASVLTGVAIAALLLVHHDVVEVLRHWVHVLGIAPGGRLVREALEEAGVLTDTRLREIGIVLLVYASLFAIEGTGLLLRRRWGEWVSIVITGSFIPIEVYETAREPHLGRILGTLVNIAAVAYLVQRVRQQRREDRSREAKPEAEGLKERRDEVPTPEA
jgi:uncharacterized membrane protein (DUF2068 family)